MCAYIGWFIINNSLQRKQGSLVNVPVYFTESPTLQKSLPVSPHDGVRVCTFFKFFCLAVVLVYRRAQHFCATLPFGCTRRNRHTVVVLLSYLAAGTPSQALVPQLILLAFEATLLLCWAHRWVSKTDSSSAAKRGEWDREWEELGDLLSAVTTAEDDSLGTPGDFLGGGVFSQPYIYNQITQKTKQQ